ncbi:MAG TPA: CaiB/BaiF CoA-transferase family protein [Acidimicrobiales bacterium]|nr:CaiB/BaiF CoA-transferase family protein [Acidimicrobiales bacterium]
MSAPGRGGPLAGVRVLEFTGLGPTPFCAMVLADLGAEVVRVERCGLPSAAPGALDRRHVLTRGRPAVGMDLTDGRVRDMVLGMLGHADVTVEGFRPGVMERLGLGPDPALAANPRLVYGRVTGYGREGPLADEAGHDINYVALAGALDPIGGRGRGPVPPLNLVADFGGGGMLLATGILAALVERSSSGRGQVVDAAMVDGAALLTTMFHEMRAAGAWRDERGTNSLDGGAHYYNVYETIDGRHLAVGAMEPRFYRAFMEGLGYRGAAVPPQDDPARWEHLTAEVAAVVRTRTQAEWVETFAGTDACVTPVQSLAEAPAHPQLRDRATFVEVGGVTTPAPAPRFGRTPAALPTPPPPPGVHDLGALASFGVGPEDLAPLLDDGVVD